MAYWLIWAWYYAYAKLLQRTRGWSSKCLVNKVLFALDTKGFVVSVLDWLRMVELHLLLLMYLHNCIYIMARLLEVRLPTDSCGKIRKFTYVQMQILAKFYGPLTWGQITYGLLWQDSKVYLCSDADLGEVLSRFCVRLRKSYVTPVGSLSVVFAR